MQKHKYNIFPNASQEDFNLLVSDIRKNGYDLDFPIILFQGDILDGWNRWRACQQIGEKPATKEFTGSDSDAINYTLRTNKRRNLTSSQWATIAVDADEIMSQIAAETERERRAKQAETQSKEKQKELSGNKLPDSSNTRTATKAACPKVRRKGVKKVVVARTFRNKNTKSFASVGELYANICKN